MPRPPTRTALAILGFLTWKPMSGYDIKKAVDASIRNFWSESYGQIYPILRRLADEGLAERVESRDDGGRRERQLYAITDAGREHLRRWLEEPADPGVARNELLLKLFFGRQSEPESNLRQLHEFQKRQRELLEKYEFIESSLRRGAGEHPDLPYWLMTVRYGKRVTQALVEWADETLAELERRES